MNKLKIISVCCMSCFVSSTPNPRQDTLQTLLPDICKVLTKTLKQWHECIEKHSDGYGLTQFRLALQRYQLITHPTMRMKHEAGDKIFIDYSDLKLWIYPHGESPRQVDVFVAT